MRVLEVCPKYYPSIGGVEEHVRNISERLAKEHQVTVFACDPSRNLAREEQMNGVSVRRFKTFSPADAYHVSLEMARELKKVSFDIVHGHSYHALPLYFAKNAEAKKFVVSPHYHGHGHTWTRNILIGLYKPFGKRILEQADKIVAISKYEKQLLVNDFAINESKIRVIPNGIDHSQFSSLKAVPRESRTILYVGRLERYKGVQYIIGALPLLDKGICLEIVGKGAYEASLMALVNRLRLNNRVRFCRDLSRQELLEKYARAGVFVLLSRHEAFSLVVAEALASRTPCIVARTSALTEWVDDRNCLGIDYPINSAELAELVARVIGKQVRHERLWDWAEVAQSTTALYREELD